MLIGLVIMQGTSFVSRLQRGVSEWSCNESAKDTLEIAVTETEFVSLPRNPAETKLFWQLKKGFLVAEATVEDGWNPWWISRLFSQFEAA